MHAKIPDVMGTRQPDQTRKTLLEAALWEMYRHGFQGASIDRLLEGTGLTKGALYHHFPNKQQLGYAVVDEVIRPWILERWLRPLEDINDPVSGLQSSLRQIMKEAPEEVVCGGCPLNNLVQEMSSIDEGFRIRLEGILNDWRAGLAERLQVGQQAGTVRTDLDADATAGFLVSAIEGIAGTAKATKSRATAEKVGAVFLTLIETLRPEAPVVQD